MIDKGRLSMEFKTMNKLIIFILILCIHIVSFADDQSDDVDYPNDPTLNDSANACYEGGSMEGKCATDWEWQCGWYLIRFESGVISQENFPITCKSLLGEGIVPFSPFPSVTGCIYSGQSNYYFLFTGGYTQGNSLGTSYSGYTSDCSGAQIPFSGRYVYAPPPYDPVLLCQTAFGSGVMEQRTSEIWRCL
jgi:hypothetical protein